MRGYTDYDSKILWPVIACSFDRFLALYEFKVNVGTFAHEPAVNRMDSLRIGKHNSEHFDVFQIDVSPRGMIKKRACNKA